MADLLEIVGISEGNNKCIKMLPSEKDLLAHL